MSNENRVKDIDSPVHDWYRFVLSFPPHLVREYIEKFGICKGDVVLDPFCGTGTTNVECKKHGIPSIGIQANPIACFASSTKCNWAADTAQMFQEAEQIAQRAADLIENCKELKCLTEEQSKLIIKNSISERPLSQVLILKGGNSGGTFTIRGLFPSCAGKKYCMLLQQFKIWARGRHQQEKSVRCGCCLSMAPAGSRYAK